MPNSTAKALDGDELALVPVDASRLTPTPSPALARPARISTVGEVVNIPVAWLDRLLTLSHDLHIDHGQPEPALVQALVLGLERIVPDVRVAIQLAAIATASPEARRVQWTEPPKSDERPRSIRVFPDAAHERSVTLPAPFSGGTLNFASDDDILGSEASPHVQMQDRAALIVAQALARGRAEAETAALRKDLRTAEAQMVQVEKLASLGQIAAGMVHELNNPLTSIAAYTDFLLRRAGSRPGTDPDDVERLRRIAESANRMLRFTRDLVSYARPSGDVPIAVGLNGVIDRALAFCEHEIVGVGVVVDRAFDLEIGPVRGLPEQLAQVFVNLITNACHAMAGPTEGRPADPSRVQMLTLSTSRGGYDPADAARVTIIVHDTGCGIAKENLPLIFTPFFTTKPAGRGTGLGLSIVKKIVDGHGGDIRAESDPVAGTRFILTFPVEDGPGGGGSP